jgi:hypothetical protein
MLREEVEHGLPALIAHLDTVVAHLEGGPNQRVSRRLVLDAFLETRSFRVTAERSGITVTGVQNIVARAIRYARGLAGLPPPKIGPSKWIQSRARAARAAMRAAKRPATIPKNVVLTTREELARLRGECDRLRRENARLRRRLAWRDR